ncbi:hypothetical protein [Nocardioides sp. L-11A]|uniref:hypothetical protein n=1 Tax=Nocardioides sp. L-11A TaxID=3043848 RepID=UPI00249B01F3|nr:hypothetical protein QJ852_25445 [Nocardioides sp. L-11A]
MALISRSGIVTIVAATGLVLTAGTSGAVAGAMITGKQIKNNTVTTKDIKNGSLTGVDVADGSLDVADLSAAVRSGLGDVTISGYAGVSPGPATLRSAPAGVSVSVSWPATGIACLRVSGSAPPITMANAVLVASPDYPNDGTGSGVNGRSTLVESYGSPNQTNCADGFAVATFLRDSANGNTLSTQPFVFLIG